MKAKEYYEKYHDQLISSDEEQSDALKKLLFDLCDEVTKIAEQRHSRSNVAVVGIFNEQNAKWNAICRLFEKNDGHPVLLEDGFKNWLQRKMPELVGQLR